MHLSTRPALGATFRHVKRLAAATLALVLYVLAAMPRGEHVPLIIVEGQMCFVTYGAESVIDVDADSVLAMRWQPGYTAWRVGIEIEVREPGGAVALRTPGRYRITLTWPDHAVGNLARCSSCELGRGPR